MDEIDERWSTEVERPRASTKRRWLLGCGLGCGALLLLAVLAMVFVGLRARKLADPEVIAVQLDEVLELEGLPEGYDVIRMPALVRWMSGADYERMWTFTTRDERVAVILISFAPGKEAQDLDPYFDPDHEQRADGEGSVGFFEPELGTLRTQGRELRVLRFLSRDPATLEEGSSEEPEGGVVDRVRSAFEAQMTFASARVDLSPAAKSGRSAYIEYMSKGTLEPVTDEELEAFLAGFDLAGGGGASEGEGEGEGDD